MDAADIGDDNVFAQRRLVDEIIDAGAERLDPFKPPCRFQHMTGEHGREGNERVGAIDIGCGFGMVIHQLDRGGRKAPAQAVPILAAYRLRQGQKNENIGHAGDFLTMRSGQIANSCGRLISSRARLCQRMIPKSGNRFPACAKPGHRSDILMLNASAGEGRSDKIMRKEIR
jgi:hypothetical protein